MLQAYKNRRPTPAVPIPCTCAPCACPQSQQPLQQRAQPACPTCACTQQHGGKGEQPGVAEPVQLDGTIEVQPFTAKDRFQLLDWEAFDLRHVFSPHRLVDKGRVNRKTVSRTEQNRTEQNRTEQSRTYSRRLPAHHPPTHPPPPRMHAYACIGATYPPQILAGAHWGPVPAACIILHNTQSLSQSLNTLPSHFFFFRPFPRCITAG